jgi:UDP-N-acetylglucosamine--N-acetylmuramyl-(pentapeptide) pyrophosphoryl-undecaprenol N-acetylglucosamine transferase
MKIIIAGGGTGGHLYPAIAIADEVIKQDTEAEIMFVGTKKGIESKVIPTTRYPISLIPAYGITRGRSLKAVLENVRFPFRLLESLNTCKSLLKKENPDVVVGTGGFVSAPIVMAAQLSGLPTLIQEQNAFPGLATRLLSLKASQVHLSFEESKKAIKRAVGLHVTGNPSRHFEPVSEVEARRFFGLDELRKTVLVFGGSLGARSINQAVLKFISRLAGRYNVIWQTGKLDAVEMKKQVQNSKHIWLNDYIDRMDMAYHAADLVVCRAGASTIAELCNLGKPAILVPYPFATDNHQYFNAKSLADKGAGILIDNKYIANEDSLEIMLNLLENESELKTISENAKKMGKPHAAENIARRILELGQ